MQPNVPTTAIQQQILKFFQQNSHAVETARGIALWLGVEPKFVQEALEGLVERGWLLTHKTDAIVGYALTTDEKILNYIRGQGLA